MFLEIPLLRSDF